MEKLLWSNGAVGAPAQTHSLIISTATKEMQLLDVCSWVGVTGCNASVLCTWGLPNPALHHSGEVLPDPVGRGVFLRWVGVASVCLTQEIEYPRYSKPRAAAAYSPTAHLTRQFR